MASDEQNGRDAASQRAMFTRLARGYDRMNRVLSFGTDVLWRRRAAAALGPAERILDVAAGTADFSLVLARANPSARVEGVDLTPAMTELGREKVRRAGLSGRVTLQTGDAAALPFPDSSFDAATCAFGFRNFPDRPAVLAEIARILSDGGRLAVLEFFRDDARRRTVPVDVWLRIAGPLFAGRVRGDYEYLRSSIRATCTAEEFESEAFAAGFAPVSRRTFFPCCRCLVFSLARRANG